eukprot:TRINITY_DN63553_c0_g1_i1.p1 TRINITY_DN63553_c0_g1~~TRINITY_DN63553_c0_g1_i1.p1  ORF type:complete len:1498 (-),score=364.61 TRINITY_DN63553_c0_g1_i1:92-4261(-)
MAMLEFDFTKVYKGTMINAGGMGHFNININSNLLESEKSFGHTLPKFFARSKNSDLHVPWSLRMIALKEMEFSVQLDLLHGGHLENLHTLNEVLDIKRYSPSRAIWGENKFFATVISKELLLEGNRELPYNMPPQTAGTPGETEVIIDIAKTSGIANDPETDEFDGENNLFEIMSAGTAYWSASGVDTVAFPWLPFFSNCEGFDSHIVIWDLFEMPHGEREGCELVDRDEVKIVPPLPVNPATMEVAMKAEADECQFVVKCHFEENLAEDAYASTPWWGLEEEMQLFYVTTFPISAEELDLGDSHFSSMEGEDSLIAVGFSAEDRNNLRIPRRVVVDFGYYQITAGTKQMVSASMSIGEFDDDETDNHYYLMLIFGAFGWEDLMNKFQLPLSIYCILYCVIGLGAVGFTLAAWMAVRVKVRKATAPPFRLRECYEFMLWWPIQGVTAATIPVFVICAFIKISLTTGINIAAAVPCTYESFSTGRNDPKEQERCTNGRTGTCFLAVGIMVMVSGSKLMIPRLREVEEQFLLQQPTHQLSKEGLTLRAEQRAQIRKVPIRWKRGHLMFVSLLLILPLIMLWEFTYCDFFGANALFFIVGFSFGMISVDNALSRSVREELIQVPLSTACSVVLFIGTLGAEDFTDFCEGFFIELLIGIFDRLVLGDIIDGIANAINSAIHWAKTRSWFWNAMLIVSGGMATDLIMTEVEEEEDEGAEAEEEEVEGTPIEEAMEEIIGCSTTCMSTIMAPFLIEVIILFGTETAIPTSYGIRRSDLVCYLLFGVVIAPFQVMMDILMNHATELANGVRIYDYMLYAKWRWRNRVTRWLFDDPRFDQSIAEPLQSVNHLAFSPQFYFIETYYTWGVLLALMSVTIFLRWNANPLDDPFLFYFAFQMYLLNRFLDKLVAWLTASVLWAPKENTHFRIFSRSVAIALKRKDAAVAQEKYRQYFWRRHTGWLVHHLSDIFTPRSREKYKLKLSDLYQQALSLQPARTYKVPGPPFPQPVAQQELPDNLRKELLDDASSDSEAEEEAIQVALAEKAREEEEAAEAEAAALEDNRSMAGTQSALSMEGALEFPPVPALPSASRQPSMLSGPGSLALGLPALPELTGPPPPPPTETTTWPLVKRGEENPLVSGFGPLAALTTRAWMLTARRRLEMLRIAEDYRTDQPIKGVCSCCNVKTDDPFVKERIGVWQNGARMKVYIVEDVRPMMVEFERHYSVPPLTLVPAQWQSWLDRHSAYATLCVRCATEKGYKVPELTLAEKNKLAEEARQKALEDKKKARGDMSDDEDEDEAEEEEDVPESEESKSDLEDAPEMKRFPGLVDCQVSVASKEMICYWAKIARKRVIHMKKPLEPGELSSEEGLDDSEDEEESDSQRSRTSSSLSRHSRQVS